MDKFDIRDPKSMFPASLAMQGLAQAVLRDDARALVEGLKAYPAGASETGVQGIGLLMVAVANGRANAVRILMRAGADPHQAVARVANLGRPAALALRMRGQPDIFSVLLEEGLDVNGGREGEGEILAVIAVMERDDLRLRQLLATRKVNLNLADAVQSTALLAAVQSNQYAKAMLLLDAGADPGVGRVNLLQELARHKWQPGSPNELQVRQLTDRLRALGLTESTAMLSAPMRPRGARR